MPGRPANRVGRSHAVNAMRTRQADFHQGPGRSPNSEAGYTLAIRPCYDAFFETASQTGGSPYTLLGNTFT